jgi:hypothetical protein
MPPDSPLTDPFKLAVLVAGGLFCLVMGLTMFYGLPRGNRWIEERQRYLVYWGLRAGTTIGGRHVWPAMVPLGGFLLLLALGGLFLGFGGLWQIPGLVIFAAAMAALVFALKMAFRPSPRFLPEWWIEEERRQRAGLDPAMPPPRKGAYLTMTRRQRRLQLLAMVAFTLVWSALGLPVQYALIGLGAGLVYLAAARIREEGEPAPPNS